MTLGLSKRGSEVTTDLFATELSKKHDVLVLQSGKVDHHNYIATQIYPLSEAPIAAPTNLLSKLAFRLSLDPRSRSVARFTRAALPHIKKFNPDIIVATNGMVQLRIINAYFPKVKSVVFGHAGIGFDDANTLSLAPDLFVALTPQALVWAKQLAPKSTRVVHIPNPISPVGSRHASTSHIDLPRPIVLTVGALSSYKNIDQVIKAVSRVQASLLLIGDGEDSDQISSLLSSFPGEFKWLKSVEPSEMPSYYNSSDIFCFVPDPQEAFGRVYLEAMAAGLPIVASDDPIRCNLIGEQGIYVDPNDLAAITQGISDAHQKGRCDYRAQLKPYLLTNVVKQIEGAFDDLIH